MAQQEIAAAFRDQAVWCGRLGSPLYERMLHPIADDVDAGGVCGEFLAQFSSESRRSLLPLRFLAMFHRQALEGRLPDLACCYPSCGGDANAEEALRIVMEAVAQRGPEWRALMPRTVQTNEVARCCALLPGFLKVAQFTSLPMRLLEIGCSAGLNLRWDHYRYQVDSHFYGEAASGVLFADAFRPALPEGPLRVTERLGCDLDPVELDEDGRRKLLSFVWPDQEQRFRQLAAGIDIARTVPAVLEKADAVDWLAAKLAYPVSGTVTVVYHSIVMLYVAEEARQRLESTIAAAGERANRDAPLAWLSMEPGAVEADVYLTLWPGGARKLIARAGFHGKNVEVLA